MSIEGIIDDLIGVDKQKEKIEDCKNDIETLKSGKNYIEKLIESDLQVNGKLDSLANFCAGTFTSDNIDGLANEQKNLNKELTSTLLDMKDRVRNEIRYLENELERLQKEIS